jgi:hypothetical protein
MKKTYALAVVCFSWTMIGAKDCNPWAGWSNPPPASSTSPSKPFCYTHPPLGCAAICKDVDLAGWTAPCSNVEAGPLTADFEDKMNAILAVAAMKGIQICTADKIGFTTTPCQVGITPVEWPNQDHTVCASAPPGCPL